MITTTRDYLGHIWQLDKKFIVKSETIFNNLEKTKNYFMNDFIVTNDKAPLDVARFIDYKMAGISEYLEFVFGLGFEKDEYNNYKLKQREY